MTDQHSTSKILLAIRCFQRFRPLLKALWINIDLGLDVRQAVVYREHAFEENGTYQQWAINNTDLTSNFTPSVSQTYFQTTCIIFFLTPLIITLLSLGKASGFLTEKGIGRCKVFLCFPLIYAVWCLICYLFAPLFVLFFGIKLVLTGNFDPEKDVFPCFPSKMPAVLIELLRHLPRVIMVEQFLLALPQLILSIVFLCNNYDFLLAFDTMLGIPLPISLISSIFSGGSLLMGIFELALLYDFCLCGTFYFIICYA